ncbi:MAG: TetR/AcrR family transcriptional regulator [Candidatus Symbiothrix sp.]|jgi:AcrR family transcriptional regulator|nr:TetR/AcrR family transcriptional regulator [Candidatus Symbiothrix sp.]
MKSKKYTDIIDAAQRLFYKYGIKKVSIEEICSEGNVSKMTFYKFFPNKTELAKTVLDKVFDNAIKQFTDLMESDLPFSEKMHGLLMMKMKSTKDANWAFIVELYKNSDNELLAHAQHKIQNTLNLVVDYFKQAQDKGWMRKDLSPTLMLVILDKMQEMSLDDRVIAAYSDMQVAAMEITKFFLYGIFDERI